MCLKRFQVFVICKLHFMSQIYNFAQICKIVLAVLYRILDTSVKVNGKYALGTCRYSTCS